MWTKATTAVGSRFALVAVALALGVAGVRAAEPERVVKAKAALAKAQAEEAVVAKEHNSRDMARAATMEIVNAARATLERTKANLAAAEETLKLKTESAKNAAARVAAEKDPAQMKTLQAALAKAEAEKAAAQKVRERRATSVKAAETRLATDTPVYERALKDETKVREVLNQKRRVTRDASRQLVFETAIGARETIALLETEKTKLEKALAAAKTEADKAAATKALTEKKTAIQTALAAAAKAETAVKELRVTITQEGIQAALNRKNAAAQAAQQKTAAAAAAAAQAAAEKDPLKKKALEAAAAKAAAEKTAAEQAQAQANAAFFQANGDAATAVITARGGLKPLAPEAWDYAKARHLLVRAGFGGTPQQAAQLQAMGLHQAVDLLVDIHRLPAGNFPLEMYPPERPLPGEPRGQRGGLEGQQINNLRLWWAKRLVESPRPLEEKMTLFWHGHFAVQYSVVQHSYTMYQQNQMFRRNAVGNFGGLLYGLVHDPAMIRYLDNNTNVKGHANENLAREIMELFAMGADQGYTEKDIREAARALTGYTYDHFSGQFRFSVKNHDETPKTIFGRTGNWTGDDLVQLILEQPATARFIARRLFEFFAHAEPAPAVVDQLAHVLRSNQYELTPMLKNLFLSEEFYSSQSMGTMIKSPVQLVAGMLRDLEVKEVADPGLLFGAMRDMGQELLEPPDVKGWRGGRAWINSNRLFTRYNTVASLLRTVPQPGGRRGVDLVALLAGSGCQSAADVVDFLARACFTAGLDAQKRQQLIEYLGALPPPAQWAAQRAPLNERLQGLLVLMLCTPEQQMS